MGLITTLRTALDLAARVQELERTVTNVALEWNDVLDKLQAREERERKRRRSQVAAAVASDCVDCGPKPAEDPLPPDSKLELWAGLRRRANNGKAS